MDAIMEFIFGSADASLAEVLMIFGVRLFIVLCILPMHEYAHGWAAHKLGDDTAKTRGRLTLNPFAHIDWLGAGMLLLLGFGYAKPVPVNLYKFRNQKKRRVGMALTAVAGPLSNLIMAIAGMILVCALNVMAMHFFHPVMWYVYFFMMQFCIINVSLALFNLLPIPPLDGSRIFGLLFPEKWMQMLERHSMVFVVGILVVFNYILPGALSNAIYFVINLLYSIAALVFNIFGAGLPLWNLV